MLLNIFLSEINAVHSKNETIYLNILWNMLYFKHEDQLFYFRIVYDEEIVQQPPPQYQNLIIQHMDIAETLSTLKRLLETRLQCSLADHQFYLQDSIEVTVHFKNTGFSRQRDLLHSWHWTCSYELSWKKKVRVWE